MQVRGLKLQASSKAATTPDAQLFACCRTVSLHIQQIQQWFSNSADQSMDSISLQLQRLSSGVFQIQLQQSRQTQATVCIKYKIDASADAVQQALDEQALTDLVKRLYLDQQDTTESQGPSSSNQELQTFSSRIASFLQLCQVWLCFTLCLYISQCKV